MPTIARTMNRLYTMLIGAVLVIAALVVAVVALVFANQTGNCVNDVLGQRANATQLEAPARESANRAETAALKVEIAQLTGRASKADVVKAKQNAVDRKVEYDRAQSAAAVYRAAHPAGNC